MREPTEVIDALCHTRFKVSGNNWHNYVHVNVEEFFGTDGVWAEAATKGVEKFQMGEYARTDTEKEHIGFGSLILVEDDDGNKKGIRSDIILANAGLHAEAARLKKIIDNRNK